MILPSSDSLLRRFFSFVTSANVILRSNSAIEKMEHEGKGIDYWNS